MIASRLWPGLSRDLLNLIVGSPLIPRPLRWRALKGLGMDIAPSRVSPTVWFGSFRRMSIGRDTFINYRCTFNTSAPIAIGARCDIGMQVTFVTSTHEIGPAIRRAGAPRAEPISLGDGVWIGAGAVILPGVTIGDGVVIAAGAVVVGDCEPNGIYGGVPARRLRDLGIEK